MANKAAETNHETTADTPSFSHFRFDVDLNGVATVLIDVADSKVNTLSEKLSEELERIMERLESDSAIRAVVFGSAKADNFVAGADIETVWEVDSASRATELARTLQERFSTLEGLYRDFGKPVVAAIHGSCLGGGLELALSCTMRISSDSPKTKLGLPEVKLGLIPGAGGTQRLPRLIGIANGLDLILTGKELRPQKARKLGVVDEVVPASILLQTARDRALAAAKGEVAPPKRGLERVRELAREWADPEHLQQLALEENAVGQRILFKRARDEMMKNTRGNYPAPERALEVVRIGVQEGLEAGYAAEADRFGQLAVSPQAHALMSIFFATQELKKENGTDDPSIEARPVEKVAMVGGGLMGAGIAAVTARNGGVPVRLKDISEEALGKSFDYVQGVLSKDVKRKRRSAFEAQRLMHYVTGTTDYSGFKSVDVVIEAVFEDLELKQRIVKEVEAAGKEDVIFASNTSSLPIAEIAKASAHPETVIGMHYFSPVEKMPLLEVVVTEQTANWVTATCVELGKAQGKTVIAVRDGTGFYTSRILAPYMNEAAWLLSEGAGIEEVDEAMKDWGFPVGPITLLDEVGIDVAGKVAGIMEKAFGDRMQAPATMQKLIDDGRKGRKNNRGFYIYEDGKKKGVDESVYALFGHRNKRKGFEAREIQERCSLQMINEAARCLEEDILRNARDGDIGAIFGLGFPPFTGGPFSYIDRMGPMEIVRRMEKYQERFGKRFEPAGVLREAADSGRRFRGK